MRIPAKSTVHAVLDGHGLVKRGRQRRRNKAQGTVLSAGATANALWCADYKGEFKLGNGQYCYPLTVTDHASRMVLMCEAHDSTKDIIALSAFQQLFAERGLPEVMRTDNGLPFASPNGFDNLSRLSAWWLRLGIKEDDVGIWSISVMHYDLGYIDLEQKTLQAIDNPFGTKVSPMS